MGLKVSSFFFFFAFSFLPTESKSRICIVSFRDRLQGSSFSEFMGTAYSTVKQAGKISINIGRLPLY